MDAEQFGSILPLSFGLLQGLADAGGLVRIGGSCDFPVLGKSHMKF